LSTFLIVAVSVDTSKKSTDGVSSVTKPMQAMRLAGPTLPSAQIQAPKEISVDRGTMRALAQAGRTSLQLRCVQTDRNKEQTVAHLTLDVEVGATLKDIDNAIKSKGAYNILSMRRLVANCVFRLRGTR
jgi:hypothetical protein